MCNRVGYVNRSTEMSYSPFGVSRVGAWRYIINTERRLQRYISQRHDVSIVDMSLALQTLVTSLLSDVVVSWNDISVFVVSESQRLATRQ